MVIQDDWYDDGPPKGFGKELFLNDLDRIEKSIEHVMELLPIMQETDIQVITLPYLRLNPFLTLTPSLPPCF